MSNSRFIKININFKKYVDSFSDTVAHLAASEGARLSRKFAPVDTGNLRNTIKVDKMYGCYAWYVAEVYAAIQEFGGVIEAKNAPMLHWVGKDGEHHFAKRVYIPAHPYMRPAAALVQARMPQIVEMAEEAAKQKAMRGYA